MIYVKDNRPYSGFVEYRAEIPDKGVAVMLKHHNTNASTAYSIIYHSAGQPGIYYTDNKDMCSEDHECSWEYSPHPWLSAMLDLLHNLYEKSE